MPITMKKKGSYRLSVFLLIIFIVLLINGCTHKELITPSATEAIQVTEARKAPTVNRVKPADKAMDVLTDTTIEAVFTTTMDPATFTTNTFTLQQGTKQIPGSVTCSGTWAIFKPNEALLYSSVYTASINTGVKDTEGTPITKDQVWAFTTIKSPEIVTPTRNSTLEVVSVVPVDESKGIPLNTTIEAIFSVEMDPATFTTKTFVLQQGTKQIPGSVTCSGTRAIFKPYEALSFSSIYTAIITTGVKDRDGNAIIRDRVWTFTTIKVSELITSTSTLNPAPEVVSVSPDNQKTGVPLYTTIGAVFSREMDPATFTARTFILQQGTKTVPGSVSCSGTKVVFIPTDALSYQSVYTVMINTGVKDLQGKSIAEDYKWSFTTVTAPVSGGSSGGSVIYSPTPTTSPTPSPVIKQVTIYDDDLPAPPVSGMTFHFVTSDTGDPGPGKIKISYSLFSYFIWFGVDKNNNNKFWVYNLPKRDTLPSSLIGFYDSLGINENAVYEEATGKYWFNTIPPWINIAKYDPTLTSMPVLVSAASSSGQAQINYIAPP
jgi:hypothetical protein